METVNLFVLVNTNVENIKDRLSAPGGPLPAPGAGVLPQFDRGYRLEKGTDGRLYEQLRPRCIHGRVHDPVCCDCFPHGHNQLKCKECVQQTCQQSSCKQALD